MLNLLLEVNMVRFRTPYRRVTSRRRRVTVRRRPVIYRRRRLTRRRLRYSRPAPFEYVSS